MKYCVWTKIADIPPIRVSMGELYRYSLGCSITKTHWRAIGWDWCPSCGGKITPSEASEI